MTKVEIDSLPPKGCMNCWMKNRDALSRLAPASQVAALTASLLLAALAARIPVPPLRAADDKPGPSLMGQTQEEADHKSAGCISCHTQTDEPTMHATGTVRLGCTDCHGGNADARVAPGVASPSREYEQVKRHPHPPPPDPKLAHLP